jgi:hypothetical protein
MYTISDLRKLLGLSTTNQVRNRIEAIKDVLAAELRRGPNNQILVSDAGADLLRRVQDLHDSGLTLTEASQVLRSNYFKKATITNEHLSGFAQNQTEASDTGSLIAALTEEIAFLRKRVAFLDEHYQSQSQSQSHARTHTLHPSESERECEWWELLREELDGT